MVGKGREWVERNAKIAANRQIQQFYQANKGQISALTDYGCLNSDATMVTLRSNGLTYPCQVSGKPGPCGPVVRLPDGSYLMRGAEFPIPHIEGGVTTPYVILAVQGGLHLERLELPLKGGTGGGSGFNWTYYVAKLSDAGDITKYYLIDTLTIAGVSDGFVPDNQVSFIGFSPDGKNIFVAFDSDLLSPGAGINMYCGWALNWSLKQVGGINVVTYKGLTQSTVLQPAINFPQAPPPTSPNTPGPPTGCTVTSFSAVFDFTNLTSSASILYSVNLYSTTTGPRFDLYGEYVFSSGIQDFYTVLVFYTDPDGHPHGGYVPVTMQSLSTVYGIFEIINAGSINSNTTETYTAITDAPIFSYVGSTFVPQQTTVVQTGDEWGFGFKHGTLQRVAFKRQNTDGTFTTSSWKVNQTLTSTNNGYWINGTGSYLDLASPQYTIPLNKYPPMLTDRVLILDTVPSTSPPATPHDRPAAWTDGGNNLLVKATNSASFQTMDEYLTGTPQPAQVQSWTWNFVSNSPSAGTSKKGVLWNTTVYTLMDYTLI
jgi:hypothetical protein